MTPTNNREEQLLKALAWMAVQYLEAEGELDSLNMSAGEQALRALEDYGLVTVTPGDRIGRWTEAGTAFLRQA
jgi:hypothetical protein